MIKYKIDPIPNIQEKKNKKNFPLPFRCLIVGTSGCGKTTLLYNLITKEWGIPFHSLYIFTNSIEQAGYKELKKIYDKLADEVGEEVAHFYGSCEDIIPIDECEPVSSCLTTVVRGPLESALGQFPRAQNSKKGVQICAPTNGAKASG